MASHHDAIGVGSGHNGLVCGAYLAKAGLRTLGLERRSIIGGAAVTEAFTASCVASNAHAKTLFRRLVAPRHLPEECLADIDAYRTFATAFKLNIAAEAPLAYRAFDPAKTGFGSPTSVHAAPGFGVQIIGIESPVPPDFEAVVGLPRGRSFYGELSADQLFWQPPTPHYADYRTPVADLDQCGSSSHPGSGVSGISGHNAAREILRD